MTNAKIAKLVDEAILIDRTIQEGENRLKEIKEQLVSIAEADPENHVEGQGGGTSYTMDGTEGSIARISFPVPSLSSKIDPEKKTFSKIKDIAGRAFDSLFKPVLTYKLVDGFRDQAAALLERRDATALIKACSTQSKPRVAFETKEGAAA